MSAANIVRVRFEGSPEIAELRLKPVGLMAAERRFGADAFTAHPIEAGLYAGWVSSGMPGGKDGFDTWAATIDELVTEEAAAGPPADAATP